MNSLNVRLRTRLRLAYVITDLITTSVAIFLFNAFRWKFYNSELSLWAYVTSANLVCGQIFFTLMLMGIYWLSGYYNRVDLRSRAQEAISTASSAAIGAVVIFFLAVVNDAVWQRSSVFELIFVAAAIIYLCVYSGRFLITRTVVRSVHNRHNPDLAVMLGTDAEAAALARRINTLRKGMGVQVTTFVRLSPADEVAPGCECYEVIDRQLLRRFCTARSVNNMIITPKLMNDGEALASLMRLATELNGALFITPDVNSIALASRRPFNVVGEPLVCISSPNIPYSTRNIKRAIDVLGSIVALIALSPVFAAIAVGVKRDSPGPVFFRQKRLGLGGKSFNILKFRSMVVDAEADGIARVTVDGDPRITRFGRFLRKYRLDELPQFINVLRGEMSLVGPRPERREFADRIAARVPLYPLLYQVRPGITSWGMVRFGYASTVDQMVERLRYDLIYLENISISTDLKILLHTVNTVVSGRGK